MNPPESRKNTQAFYRNTAIFKPVAGFFSKFAHEKKRFIIKQLQAEVQNQYIIPIFPENNSLPRIYRQNTGPGSM